jgi:Zn-dependent protease
LALAAAAAVILRFFGIGFNSFSYNAVELFITVNVGLFAFNMIPIPPLDGSRVLYAVAPEPLQNLMRQIEAMGFMVIIFILLVAFPLIAGPLGLVQRGILNFLLG